MLLDGLALGGGGSLDCVEQTTPLLTSAIIAKINIRTINRYSIDPLYIFSLEKKFYISI